MSNENPYVVGPSPYDEDVLRELYHDRGLTLHEVADELDRDPVTIQKWMDDFGIERRQCGPKKNTELGK